MVLTGNISIRATSDSDLQQILNIERQAFNSSEEAELTFALLNDASAQPTSSFLALYDDSPAGHILFTKARIHEHPSLNAALLAPLAVVPRYQQKGVGSALVTHGLRSLKDQAVNVVFVLGHPSYYPKFGFTPAHNFGFRAPYPIDQKNLDAWMVNTIDGSPVPGFELNVECARSLQEPKYWAE
jgi:putative acetyltransferase